MGDKGSTKRKKKSRPQEEDSEEDLWDSEDDDDTIARIQRAHFAQTAAGNNRRRAPVRQQRMSNKRKLEAVKNFHDFTKKLKKDTGISIRSLVGDNILELSEFSSEDTHSESDGLSEEEFVVNPNAVEELNDENESYIDPETGDIVEGKKVERKKSISKSPEPAPEAKCSEPQPKTLSISDIINEDLDLSKNVEIAEVEESELCPEKELLGIKEEDSSSQDFDMKKLTEMDEISVKPVKPEGEKEDEGEQKTENDEDKKPINTNALNVRRNIREVMDEKNLDASTLAAQRQESERLARVQEQQRIIREVQRQIAINRQNKIHQKTLSLLQGGSSILKKSTGQKLNLPNTVLVKLPSGEVKKTTMKQGQVEVTKVMKPGPSGQKLKKEVVEIVDSSSGEESSSSSSDSDDCIMLSDSEVPPSPEAEEDPGNSGLHVNDAYNTPDEQGRVLINIGHTETEEDIFLAPQIARVIKPHQIGGVRFLFDNIIESVERFSTSTGFGCILAHSMGLGKTLQIVCFCDIFLRHTNSKTVLCIMPINTLQNWVAEFNMWLPLDPTNSPLAVHGEVRPRNFPIYVLNDSHKTLQMRAKVVKDWSSTGGVLMIGYELYRLLSMKKDKKPRKKKEKKTDPKVEAEKDDKKFDTGNDDTQDSRKTDDMKVERDDGDSLAKFDPDLVKEEKKDELADEDKKLLDEMYEALVRPGPDLVICDEGHRIKNSHSNISYALKQMRTKRRIVLTGYPLQNNLLEYWCMVDFVRPNYLGSKTEFCNMFERPIQNGQCIDSTPQDIRLMRYRAHVLHSLLVGFVQRRSHAVLQSTLPQKEEYVLLVRMTPLQRKLYDRFMNEVVRSTSVPNPLKAFAICCKIWNHPDVLYNFLRKRSEVNAAIEEDLDLEEIGGVTKAGRAKNKTSGRKPAKPRGSAKKPAATIQPNVAGPKGDPRNMSGPPFPPNGPYGPQGSQGVYRPDQPDRSYPYPPYQGPGYYPPNQGFDQQYDNAYYSQQQQQQPPYGNNYPNQYPPSNTDENQGYNQNYWGSSGYYNNSGFYGNSEQFGNNPPPADFSGPQPFRDSDAPSNLRPNPQEFPNNQAPPAIRGPQQFPGNQSSQDFRGNSQQYSDNQTPEFRGNSQPFPNTQSASEGARNPQPYSNNQPPSDLQPNSQYSNNQQPPDMRGSQPYPNNQGPHEFRGNPPQFPNNQTIPGNQPPFANNETALDLKPNPPHYGSNQQLPDHRGSQPLYPNNQQSSSDMRSNITSYPNQAQDFSRNAQQFSSNSTTQDSRANPQMVSNNQSGSSTEMNSQQYPNNQGPDFRRTQQYPSGPPSNFGGTSQQYPNTQPPSDFRPNSQPYTNNQPQTDFGNAPQSYPNSQSTSEMIRGGNSSDPYNSQQYPSNYSSTQSDQPYTGSTLQPYNSTSQSNFGSNQRPYDQSSFHNTPSYGEYNQNSSTAPPYPNSQTSQSYSNQNYSTYPGNSSFPNDTPSSYNQFGNQPQNYSDYGNRPQNSSITDQAIKTEPNLESNYQSTEKKCEPGVPQNPRDMPYGNPAYNYAQSNSSMYPEHSISSTCQYPNYGPPVETKPPLGSGSPITPWPITESLKTEVDKIKAEEKIEMKSESDGEVKIEDLDTKKIVKDGTTKGSLKDNSLKPAMPSAVQPFNSNKKAGNQKSDESDTEKETPKKCKRGRPKGSKNGDGKARQRANQKPKGRKDRKTSKEKTNEDEHDSEESEKEEKLNKEEELALVKKAEEMTYDWATELLKDYIPGIIENSAKMELFFYILNESIKLGDRILLFSQSLFTLNLIEDFLVKNYIPGTPCLWERNTSYFRLDGSTHALEREKLINEFNANPNVYLFLVSTRAGSLGINLVGANRVIVFDASWNPCHDTQAVCRVYRYGQKKPCFVYRFVMDWCLEKKIYDRQINKQGMADRVVDECNPDAVLSMKEITNLCFDNDEKESEPKDLSEHKDKYIDVLMQGVITLHGKLLSKEPFQHESLLVDRKEKKLSSAEKRLAQRGYELEKKAASAPKPTGAYRTVRAADGSLVQRPVASVRPMQAAARWIPADVWRRQGMTAQEMTLPLDVVIPTNSTEKTNIVLKAGQRVMVLKSPKGIYMQLESGKIIAIKTSLKGLQKGVESKDNPIGKKVIGSRPSSTNIPGSLKNNSAITITSKTGPRPGFNRVLTRPSMFQNKVARPMVPGQKLAEIRNRLGELRSYSPIRGKSLIPQGRLLRPNLPGSVSITRILKDAKKPNSDNDRPTVNKINTGSEEDAQILDSDDDDDNSTKEASKDVIIKENEKAENKIQEKVAPVENNTAKSNVVDLESNKQKEFSYNDKEQQPIVLTTDEKLPSEEALESKTTKEVVDMTSKLNRQSNNDLLRSSPGETIERKINLLKNYRHQRPGSRPQNESSLSQLEKTASVLNNEGAPDFRKNLDDITQSYSPGLEEKSATKSKKKKSPAKTSNVPESHNDIAPSVANMSHSVSNLLGNSSSSMTRKESALPLIVPAISTKPVLPSHGNNPSMSQDSSGPMGSRGHGYGMAQSFSASPHPSISPNMGGIISSSSTPNIDSGKISGVPSVPTPIMAAPSPSYPPANALPPEHPYGQYPGYGMGFGAYPGGWEYGGYGAAPPYYPGYGAQPYPGAPAHAPMPAPAHAPVPAPAHAPLPAPAHAALPANPPEGYMPPNPQW